MDKYNNGGCDVTRKNVRLREDQVKVIWRIASYETVEKYADYGKHVHKHG